MAFPSNTTLIDNFNRADQNPPGAPWSSTASFGFAGNLGITSNALLGSNGGSVLATSYGADIDFYWTLVAFPSTPHFCFRVSNSTSVNWTGYRLDYYGSGSIFRFVQVNAGTSTILGTAATWSPAAGNKVGVQVRGGTFTGFLNTGGGWTQIGSWTDPSPLNTSGGLVGFSGLDASIDDLTGGNAVTSTTYPQSLSVSTAPTTVAKRQMAKAASGIQATSASISKLAGYARSLPASQASAPTITPNARLARTLAATQAGVNNYDAVILADSPTSFWKLNELSGTTAADASGTNVGTYSGGVTLNQPGMGDGKPSVLLDGSTGYITVPSATNLHPASSVSAECWVYPTVSPAAMGFIASNAATTSYGYELGTGIVTNSGITPQFASKFSGGTNYGASSAIYLTQNAWNHVVGTFDGTVMTVYINGVNVGSTTYGAFTMTYENNEFRIGRGSTATGQFFQGRIAKVAVYPVALTAAKVLAHYNAASNALGPIPATASGVKTATPLVRTFSTTQTSSTGAIKSPGKTLGLAQASIEAVSRQTKRTLGLTQVNSAMASRSSMRALSTLQASASGATKALSRAISVGQASNVTATRSASRKFTVAEPSSAGLASGRAFLRSLAVTETSNSSITKTNQRTLSVPQVSGQVITRQNSRVLVIAQSSSETTKKTAARAMLVTEAGSVGVLHGGFFSKAFSATQSSIAAQTGRFQFNRTFSPSQGTFITLTAPAGRRVTLTLSQASQASAVGTYFMPPRVIKGTVTRGRASQTHVGVQRQGFGGATH